MQSCNRNGIIGQFGCNRKPVIGELQYMSKLISVLSTNPTNHNIAVEEYCGGLVAGDCSVKNLTAILQAILHIFNHSYDYRLNWTPLSPITIIYIIDKACSVKMASCATSWSINRQKKNLANTVSHLDLTLGQ